MIDINVGVVFLAIDGSVYFVPYDSEFTEPDHPIMAWPYPELSEESRLAVSGFLGRDLFPRLKERDIHENFFPCEFWEMESFLDEWEEGRKIIISAWANELCRKGLETAERQLFSLERTQKEMEKAAAFLEKSFDIRKKISVLDCIRELNFELLLNLKMQKNLLKSIVDFGLVEDGDGFDEGFSPEFSIFAKRYLKNDSWEEKWLFKRDFSNIYEDGEKMTGTVNVPADDPKEALRMMHELLARGGDGRVRPIEVGLLSWNWWGEPEREDIERIVGALLASYGMESNWLVWRAGKSGGRGKLSYCLLRINPALAMGYGQWHIPRGMFLDERSRRGKPDTNSLACREWACRILDDMFTM